MTLLLQGVNMSMNDFVSAGSHRMSKVMTFAFAWSQNQRMAKTLLLQGIKYQDKCDLASAGGQHVNE